MFERPATLALSLGICIGAGACAGTPTENRYDTAFVDTATRSGDYEASRYAPDRISSGFGGEEESSSARLVPALQDDPTQEVAAARGWAVVPRLWYAKVGTQDSEEFRTESYRLPMFGASVAWSPETLERFSFLATLLVGSGSGEIFVPALGATGSVDSDRIDLELLARYSFPGKGFFIFFGPR